VTGWAHYDNGEDGARYIVLQGESSSTKVKTKTWWDGLLTEDAPAQQKWSEGKLKLVKLN